MEDKVQETNKQSECIPSFTIYTMFAGIIWIVLGSFSLLAMFYLTKFFLTSSKEMFSGSSLFIFLRTAVIFTFLGIGFTYIGVQTIMGKARDVIVPSICSILMGLFILLKSVQNGDWTIFDLAVVLVIAGILALIGRSQYKAWRNARIKKTDDSKV
ncbi:MAG: hypothetical protein KJ648_01685, partial [Candidatus Omnitrophica bacterium]|nr:hypothetical protein [Candidatus Omnitrophota bacterium]